MTRKSNSATKSLYGRRSPLVPGAEQLRRLAAVELNDGDNLGPTSFSRSLLAHGVPALRSRALEIFQVNLGKLCNMTCRHCHVDAGPDRGDAMMSSETVDAVLRAMTESGAHTVDLTGGAPELHPDFSRIVDAAVFAGKHVIDRCNLTILLLPKYRALPQWMADRGVEIVASLPHYRQRNTDAQRGDGTFERSIEAIKALNRVGYGKGDPTRILTLMSNPSGAFLGGAQQTLEDEWKAGLLSNHGVTFDRLLVLNNMPISRFLEWLEESGNLDTYMQRLVDAFNPAAIGGLMCRNTVSISWDGFVYDCDFNQMLEIPACNAEGQPLRVQDLDITTFSDRMIHVDRHCYGCTAGSGSGCAGATTTI